MLRDTAVVVLVVPTIVIKKEFSKIKLRTTSLIKKKKSIERFVRNYLFSPVFICLSHRMQTSEGRAGGRGLFYTFAARFKSKNKIAKQKRSKNSLK